MIQAKWSVSRKECCKNANNSCIQRILQNEILQVRKTMETIFW